MELKIEKEFEMTAIDGAFDFKATISQSRNSVFVIQNKYPRKKDHGKFFCNMSASQMNRRLCFALSISVAVHHKSNQTSI